ncbi:polysaccharide biosynthesis protein [Candidatus Bathyarchaeota archaeon]|nr:polysaccharide biosynthesis protein [Candidatus Bathyarchaeota archaeon]
MLERAKILITGGSGFLGKHLIEWLLTFPVAEVIAYARDEKKHYELRKTITSSRLRSIIGDVRDLEALTRAVDGVDYVIHAAAMKHVTHCESYPDEAYKTNVLGASNVVLASKRTNNPRVIFISTDKAVAPVNVYGATKMLAEQIFRSSGCKCVGVRYGNVLSSAGSVVPFFRERAQAKQTLPVTDPNMTRFLIPVEQAVGMVVHAMHVHAAGQIYVPMLKSARVGDIAEVFAEKYGAKTEIVGPRPGEKLHESLLSERDAGQLSLLDDEGTVVIRNASDGFESMDRGKDAAIDLTRFRSDGPVMTKSQVFDFLTGEGAL